MIELPDSSDADDDIDDLAPVGETPPAAAEKTPTSTEVLSRLALGAALGPRYRRLLKEGPRLLIIKVPDESWVDPIGSALGQIDATFELSKASERTRSGGKLHRVGEAYLSFLQERKSVVYVCQDPEEILHEAVLAAADATIEIPALTPALLRRTIREVTGGAAVRGVTTPMAALDLPIIFSAIRLSLTARECVAKLREAVTRNTVRTAANVPQLADLPLTGAIRNGPTSCWSIWPQSNRALWIRASWCSSC